ncbi:hypothetical protein KZZ52_05470 [Dactylosporangium sp. AC04546]|uniref:hypothetical protein n=1 Tax=Dactylosporangium sp. AC04546 TaxID=2862460 RepID=UPI001EDF43CE|nr:hypothetical protein [Dactylosporangium sp. AC04546]WVK84857.1 hypothetical protein KZZ52_05470 [Dactylosporangium sp. AC04546]
MRRVLLAVAALVLATACGLVGDITDPGPDLGVPLTTDDVVGTWRNEQLDGTVTFAADGTFTAANVPYEAFTDGEKTLPPGFDKATARIGTTGRWQLTGLHPGQADDRQIVVRAMFDKAPEIGYGFGKDLVSERQDDGVTGLVMVVPNAPRFGDRYVYRKCAAPCAATPSPSHG